MLLNVKRGLLIKANTDVMQNPEKSMYVDFQSILYIQMGNISLGYISC